MRAPGGSGALAALLLLLAVPGWALDAGTPARPRFAWPSLQVLAQVESNEVVEAGGIPVMLRALHVKESTRELVQRFADAFRAGGLYVPPGKEQPQLASNAAMLTAVDPSRGITYTVVLQPQPDGTTVLYLGEANHALARAPAPDTDFAPLPPGATGVLRVNTEGSRTLTFQVALPADKLQAFYEAALPRAGWKRGAEAGVYTRAGEELRLVHEPGEGGRRAVVLLLQASSVR